MGSIFRRGNRLWLKYKTVAGKWTNKPTGLDVGHEDEAAALLEKTESNVQALIDVGETGQDGPLTVERYAERWLSIRETRELTCAIDDRGRFKHHVGPTLGKMQLNEVRPRHVRDLIRKLREGKQKLAPRTLRHVYAMLHTFFHDALVDELIDSNPCLLQRC